MRKRVLMLLENCVYPRDDRVRREAKSLVSAGYHVTVISPKFKEKLWHEEVEGVCVYRFPQMYQAQGFLGYFLEYAYTMIAIGFFSLFVWIKDGFDILHAHHPPDTFVFIAAFFKLFGKKYVLDHHDLAPELYYARFKGKGKSIIYKSLIFLEKLSCRMADHVIATNQSYQEIEVERDKVALDKITIVRNGPDLKELCPSLPDEDLRKRAHTIIGYVGVMGIQDGVDNLIKALKDLVCKYDKTDFLCVLVGSGAAVPELKILTKELGLSNQVYFTGWVNDQEVLARYLSSMDICVAPEPSDPYNDRSTAAKIMEYMTFAKPIVAFDLPEHRFTAQDAALYARPSDIQNFAELISCLIDDAGLRTKLGEDGRKRLITELAWTYQEKALLEMYEKSLS
jgi:glycosyltransferase involved in cell wall biosynthesis